MLIVPLLAIAMRSMPNLWFAKRKKTSRRYRCGSRRTRGRRDGRRWRRRGNQVHRNLNNIADVKHCIFAHLICFADRFFGGQETLCNGG